MKPRRLGKALIACAIGVSALVSYRSFGWDSVDAVNSLGLDLAAPDALILTHSLSALPRDLLTVSLARDVLREDFVFYYEQGEDRLGLKGSLRRIAYEHELHWGDELIRMVLDQPAEVALWRDPDGTLKHYAIALERTRLARLFEEAGKVALKDAQVRLAGELRVGEDSVPVYAFEYAHGRTLLFAASGERMVILSHPGMLYGGGADMQADSASAAIVAALLGPDPKARQVFRRQFQLPDGLPAGHSVAVKTDFLSFGYQPFFGALQALRFDFSKGAWQSQVLIDGARLRPGGYDSSALWAALPHGASACFSVPADWSAMEPVLRRLGGDASLLHTLPAQFAGPVAACWYGDSRLYTPVFVAQRATSALGAGAEAQLDGLFGALVGGESEHSADGGVQRWSRSVQTPAGPATPTLAANGRTVVFSADAALVDRVLAVGRKQAPATADLLPDAGHTVGIVNPGALSRLVEKEAFEALPAASEPVLRGAAEAHLLPRLAALGKYPAYRMVVKTLPAGAAAKAPAWTPLEWQSVR